MLKFTQRAISLLLALTLLFSVMTLCVSATINEGNARSSTATATIGSNTFRGTASRASGSVTATSTFTVTAGITSHARMYYTVPASTQVFTSNSQNSNAAKSVSATATTTGATSVRGFGGHTLSYNGSTIQVDTKC